MIESEVTMCMLKDVGHFIKNGISTFREASQGCYRQDSEAISEIRKEIFGKRDRTDDKRNLMKDRKNIEGDVRKSFNEIILNHG